MTTYTKKFKEFLQEWNPENDDYVVGYRSLDDSEIRIPLVAIDNSITANKYIRKDIDDYANGIIRFNKGFTVSSNVMSTIYLQGLTGWMGTQEGDFEMNSLILREFLEVPELRKNKITVMGNQFWFTDSAMVKEVIATGSGNYDVYFKLEEEEYAPFELNDILKGIYHYSNGFWTCYLKVYELILNPDTQGEIGVKVHSMNSRDPRKSMLLARINNSDDPERQGSIFADGLRRYIRVLYGYDENNPTAEGSLDTLKVQMGDLSTITNHPIFGNLEGYGLYADNVYLTGKLIVKNDPNQPGQQLGVYRGPWNADTNYYKYDQVTYNGSLYTSKQIDNIGHTPQGGPDDLWWELTVSKGADGESGLAAAMIELTNDNHLIPTDSEGKNPVYGGAFCTAYVYQGTTDLTDLFTITVSVQAPVTEDQLQFVQNQNTVTITYISDDIDNAAIKFIGTAEGYPTVEKTWNIAKTKSGVDGQSPTAYWIVTDSPVIKKRIYSVSGTEVIQYEPSPFVVRAFSQTGTEDIKQCDGYFKITYGLQTQVISGSVYQFIPEADVLNYTIEFYLDKELTTLVDKEIVTVVSDGTVPNWYIYIFKASDTIPDIPTYKTVPTDYPTPEGWVDYPTDSTSIWWMSTATVNGITNGIYEWSKPVKVTGEDGKDGTWVDFKFAKNNDYNNSPDIVVTDRHPAGWNDTTPAIGSGEYLWMTNATINPDDTLKTNWSNPVRISGEKGDQGEQGPQGPQGLHGEDGLQGPSIVFAGNWESDKQYYGYNDTQTCVYYNGKYYYTKTVSPDLSPVTIPSGDANHPASDTGKVYWNEFVGQFDNIATGLLLAERIATSELAANKIFIVDREESSGNIIAADGSIITKEEEANLNPNEIIGRLTQGWYLDQGVIRSIAVDDNLQPILKMDKDGRITATGVTVTGTVHFQNGTIGSMTVYGDSGWQSSVNGPYLASTGYYYLRKENGVTITPEGHIIGKDYFLTGDSSVGPSVFIGDVYVPGSSVPGTDDDTLSSFLKLFNTLFERVLIGEQYVIKAKLPLFSIGEITAYGSDGMEVPSLWEGIPVDKVTIDLIDGKLTVIGGTGGIKSIVLPAMTEEDALVGATLDEKGEIITFTKGTFATKSYVDSHVPTSMPWSAITGKPTTIKGYGITDAVIIKDGDPDSTTDPDANYPAVGFWGNVGSYFSMVHRGWGGQLKISNRELSFRGCNNLVFGDWTKVITEGNYTSTLDTRYRPMNGTWKAPTAPGTRQFGWTSDDGQGEVSFSYSASGGGIGTSGSVLNMSIDGNIFCGDNGYMVWHQGNDGSGSGLDADLLGGYHSSEYLRSFWTHSPGYDANNTGINSFVTFTYSNNAPQTGVLADLCTNGYGVQFNTAYKGDTCLYYRRHGRSEDGGIGTWQQLARVTDNIASATQLQTPRTIWGQSFDGTGNVSGDLSGCTRVKNSSNQPIYLGNSDNSSWVYTQDIGSHLGISYWAIRQDGTANFNGNVGIGTTSPSRKLSVYGDMDASSIYVSDWFRSIGNNGWYSQTYGGGIYMEDVTWVRVYNNRALYVTNTIFADGYNNNGNNYGYIVINKLGSNYAAIGGNGAINEIKFGKSDINGAWISETLNWRFEGNIVATGEVTAYSDQRLKSNIEPLVYRGRLNPKSYIKDNKQSIGFIAQDVQELYPELVMETGGDNNYLSLNYGNITAVLSAQINTVEDEVTTLKRRVKELELEIEILKKS